jgi:hypothetical protein
MLNIVTDARMRAFTILGLCAAGFILSLYLIPSSANRYSVNAIRKENGRVEITSSDNFLFIFPSGKETIAPVTNARMIEDVQDSLNSVVKLLLFTTKGKFELKDEKIGLDGDEKKEFFKKIVEFTENQALTDFNESFYSVGLSFFLGLILAISSIKIGYAQYRDLPSKAEGQTGADILKNTLKNAFNKAAVTVAKKAGEISENRKTVKAAAGTKATIKPKLSVTNDLGIIVDRVIKVILPGYDRNIVINPDIFRIPEVHGIAIACTSSQLAEMKNRYGNDIEYIVCSGIEGGTEMIRAAVNWTSGFKGYLIVQTDNLSGVKQSHISALFRDHKAKYSECTILSKEVSEKKVSKGMIVKNIADRVMKISETEEVWEVPDKNAEVYAGVMLFNLVNLNLSMNKFTSDGSNLNLPFIRIVDLYQRSRFKINTFSIASAERARPETASSDPFAAPVKKIKTFGLIITAPATDKSTLLKSYDIISLPEIESTAFVARSDLRDTIGELFGDEIRIITTDGDYGDGFDASKAQEWLKNMNGNVVVISGDPGDITKETISSLIEFHNSETNTCTYIRSSDKVPAYCLKADYFVYSAKRIIKDDETKKYNLPQIVDILIADKKKVQEFASN